MFGHDHAIGFRRHVGNQILSNLGFSSGDVSIALEIEKIWVSQVLERRRSEKERNIRKIRKKRKLIISNTCNIRQKLQLQRELRERGWIPSPISKSIITDLDNNELKQLAFEALDELSRRDFLPSKSQLLKYISLDGNTPSNDTKDDLMKKTKIYHSPEDFD